MELFKNRESAGKQLAVEVSRFVQADALVLALPRGGVPVAWEIAKDLDLAMDLLLVKKIAAPEAPEFAIGAVAEDDPPIWSRENLGQFELSQAELNELLKGVQRKILRQRASWCGEYMRYKVRGRQVILVDDGLATGLTMRAAVSHVRRHGARQVVVAVPVAAKSAKREFKDIADEIVILETPEDFSSVGRWYDDFAQVADAEVTAIVAESRARVSPSLTIPINGFDLPADLAVPKGAKGIILFAHGSGSSRRSPRNQYVAKALNQAGFATLLFDLLTPQEATSHTQVFAIPLLAERLIGASRWARQQKPLASLPMLYFGASTGAAAALVAAAQSPEVSGVVSRGGRPDLAGEALKQVGCPVLLVVGGNDQVVIELNKQAQRDLKLSQLFIVPEATHLFAEPGALDSVIEVVQTWLQTIPLRAIQKMGGDILRQAVRSP